MTKLDKTDITFVLDASGSMYNRHRETCSGYNDFLREQQGLQGECRYTLMQFNTYFKTTYEDMDIMEAPALSRKNYRPDGGTALLDAIGNQIISTGNRLAAMKETERPERVVFVIVTDGHENMSCKYTQKQIKDMIDHQEATYNWEFLYLGAGQDAIAVGAQYGIKPGKALSVGLNSMAQAGMWKTATRSVSSYRANGAPADEEFFTEAERTEAKNLGGI